MSPPREQLPLPYEGGSVADAWWQEILGVVREVVELAGPKDAAYQLDVRASFLSNALAERDRCELKLRHLPQLLAMDKHHDLIRALAAMAGFDLVPKKVLAPEERLAALEAALKKCLGPEVRAAIEAEARRQK